MKLVLCDYPATLRRGTAYEEERLRNAFPDAEIVAHPFTNQEALLNTLRGADGCITGFLHLDESVFSQCPMLKVVSINASAYNTVDLDAARRHSVTVCAVRDYCTQEVAEHTMALLLASVRKLKVHEYRLEKDKVWAYKTAAPVYRLAGQTLVLFGFGRIGQAVAQRARAFDLKIRAVDPYLPPEVARRCGVQLVTKEQALEEADLISNHMSVSAQTMAYFNWEFFEQLKRAPIFVNVARGASVDENALLHALETGKIRSAALDVLQNEQPDPQTNPLFQREDVIITPHAAFYSEQSIRALQEISCDNLIAVLQGKPEQANYILQ